MSTNEAKLNPTIATLGVYYKSKAGPCSFLCIWVIALLCVGMVVIIPQEFGRIGTFSHFKLSFSDKAPSVPHVLKSHTKDAEAANKAEGSATCHMISNYSQNINLTTI